VYKLVWFVPEEALDATRDAVFAAGGGLIGEYERCSWYTEGTGTFLGGEETAPVEERGQGIGFGRRLVFAARQMIGGSGVDLALFTCDRDLQGFYEDAGWQHLPGTVLIGGTETDPFPSDRTGFDKVTMAEFFTDHARPHRARFVHARLDLFPGEVDRLW